MCHDSGARPPVPPVSPVAGGAGSGGGQETILEANDGNRLAAFTATADIHGGPGIVILPDVRGLHGFYSDLALRFAEAGVHATAIDYFGRTAGVASRGDDFDWMTHVQQTSPDSIAADVAAVVAHVRSTQGGAADRVFTVGFCFGGRNSFNQAARGHGLDGVIGFYGMVAQRDELDANAPILLAGSYRCPVLGLFGGTDQLIAREHVEAFGKALDAAGVRNELVTYDSAPHSFFDRTYEQFKGECDDAWIRIRRFMEGNR